MYLEFYGAVGGVTGSLHRVHANKHDVILDCGLFQGHRAEANHLNRNLPGWATKSKSAILSHAHLDHSGNLPSLVKDGFRNNIYCTPPTRDLCSVMLRDAAMIQEQDARYLNKRYERQGDKERIEPIYTIDDAQRAMSHMISVPLHRKLIVSPGVEMTFLNAGHVLGSALIQLDIEENGKKRRIVYTGDLGRDELPLLDSPEIPGDVDVLIMESTYGDRTHPDIASVDEQLANIVNTTIDRKGRVYVPTFALERAQEVLFALERLHEAERVPRVPIYIDSPLAIAITEIYKLHPAGLDPQVCQRILDRNDPFSPPGLHYISDIESSRRLQNSDEPCIIIAGSGMCEGGRILHHFARGLSKPQNSVVIVGFMAQHTLGRRLVERRKSVKVYGVLRDVYATIHTLDGLSAHADEDDLITFAKRVAAKSHLRHVALVHGEDRAREKLSDALQELGINTVVGETGDRLEL